MAAHKVKHSKRPAHKSPSRHSRSKSLRKGHKKARTSPHKKASAKR